MSALSKYVNKFTHLKRGHSQGRPAPHKPILLLSILEGIETGEIIENKIRITPELVARFKDYWHQLVDDQGFTSNFSLPFYHLKSDGFWHLNTYLGRELVLTSSNSIRSFAQLKEVIEFASFDEELFDLLLNEHTRLILKQALLTQYFPGNHIHQQRYGLVDEVINQILNDYPEEYKKKAEYFDEEDVFVRGGIFKKEVPRIYNYTCSISGLRIITDSDIQMIDACHILPFSESHDDTISNGISLCPNLHRAFDRGLIAIDDNYRVLVKSFSEQSTNYSIKQFQGKQILLPNVSHYRPSLENLQQHRVKHIFQ
jgi:putative restriction endonuclease